MNSKVDTYLQEGCGRCANYKTPQCKVHRWTAELKALRHIVLAAGLTEDYKWSQPCYTYKNKNICIVTAFKDYACLSFFKGSLLKDPENILVAPGKSSQAARQIRFTNVNQVRIQKPILISYILNAIQVEKEGLRVKFKEKPEPMPEELKEIMKTHPEVKIAFDKLTPGRQRGYILYFIQPKNSKTRVSRIMKSMPKILKGEGMHDAYRKAKK